MRSNAITVLLNNALNVSLCDDVFDYVNTAVIFRDGLTFEQIFRRLNSETKNTPTLVISNLLLAGRNTVRRTSKTSRKTNCPDELFLRFILFRTGPTEHVFPSVIVSTVSRKHVRD